VATRTRIGRYDNPYMVAEWHREPPAATSCEALQLITPDRGVAQAWLYARGGEDTAVVLMHPRANFSHHYTVPGLVEAGFAVCCVNSRWLNNDATLIHEVVLLDVAAAVAALRTRYERIVFCGNSGGGSLFSFYLSQSLAPEGARLTDTAAGDPFDLNRFELPPADAMIYLGAHPGEGHFLLHAIDPSVIDEEDPVSCDPAFDLYDPSNGFVEPPKESRFAPEFVSAYRAAQRARVERIDAEARFRVARRHAARARWKATGSSQDRRESIATDFLFVYRTDADPRYIDLSIDPSKRSYGSLWGVRPDWINYGAVGFGRMVAPEAWLSTWSGLSSRAEIARTGPRMTLPALMISYSGDHCIFPSDNEHLARSLGTRQLERLEIDADHYGFPAETGRDAAVAAMVDWLRR
jgi:hypothetical protein